MLGHFSKPISIGIALALSFQASSALSEEYTPAWSFEQMVHQALVTHPAVLAQQSLYDAAKADLDVASWQRYPTPSLQASRQKGDQYSDHQYNEQSNTALTLQQPLWTGGKITADIDSAKFSLDAAEAAIEETRQSITLNLISAYTEALRLQTRQEHATKNVHEHEKLLELVTRRVEHEVTAPVDKGLAQSRLYQAMNELSSETEALSNAMMQLSQLVGKNIEKIAPLNADNEDVPKSEKDAQQQATDHSPTLARLASEEAVADANIDSKRSAYLPQIALVYQKTSADPALTSLPGNSIMLVMKVLPGAGLSSASGVTSAIAKRQAAKQNYDAASRDLQVSISTDWHELVAARLRFENASLSGKISDDVFESYVRQYTTGSKGWLDVLNSAQEAANNKIAAADAAAQISRSALRLRLLTGNLKVSSTTN